MKIATYFNPFVQYNEKKLFVVGIVTALLGGILASAVGVVFDGVLDLHLGEYSISKSVLLNFLQIATMAAFLYAAALLTNNKTRFIDILNISLLYRVPFYITTLIINFQAYKNVVLKITKPEDLKTISGGDMIGFIVVSIFSLLFLVWSMIIVVNGFKVACNAKKTGHYLLLAVAILLAEAFSKFIFYKITI